MRNLEFGGVALIIAFVVAAMVLDLFIGSAAAKWALIAPIFVPMFMILGYSPELTLAAYRIGDSVINIVSPLMAYFPLIVAFGQKYDKNFGVGSLMALMLPYSVTFFLGWTLFRISARTGRRALLPNARGKIAARICGLILIEGRFFLNE